MQEKDSHQKHNIFSEFLHQVKEYILIFAMVIAAVFYLSSYINKIPGQFNYLKWIISAVVIIIIISLYFFTVRPALLKKKELNLRPKGEPDQNYFTTSPRTDDKYQFFSSGYEQYVEWLMHPKSSILYLTGPSGSGKSSLINAYIAPQLEKRNPPKTNVYLLRSYHDPLKELYEALKIEENTNTDINEETVFEVISKAGKMLSPGEQILIVLDQFEEFFLLRNRPEELIQDGEELQDKVSLIKFFHRFMKDPPKGVYILLSYRDDFQQLIDQLELPARTENVNFKQVKLLTIGQASAFLKNCPGLEIPEQQIDRILKEATTIDSPITLRPIVLNLLGIILQRMVGQHALPKKEGTLIRQYILNCLGKELKEERAAVLKTMLTDFNTARPRTIQELCKNSGLTISQLDNQMIVLHQHGLVRCLDIAETSQGKRKWQIAHDFVALQLEKVVHGVGKTFWQKSKKWVAPALTIMLLFFSTFYFNFIDNRKKNKAIDRINKAGLLWNRQTKSISGNNIKLSDSLFLVVLPDIVVLQPDSLEIIYAQGEEQNQKISNLQVINKVKSLENVRIVNNNRITDLNGIEDLTELTHLEISECGGLQNVNGLKGLPALTDLNLSSCWSLQNLNGLNGLSALTNLNLSSCKHLEKVDGLKNLPALKNLNLSRCEELKNVDGLNGLPALVELNLAGCIILKNVDGLNGLSSLAELKLDSCIHLENADGLNGLKELTVLNLYSCDNLKNIDGLKGLKKLATLKIRNCNTLINIDGVKGLTALADLHIDGCKGLQNIDCLTGVKTLIKLNINNCDSLKNIDGIKGLTALKELNISNCDGLMNADALDGLTALTKLNLSNHVSLKNPDVLKDFKDLIELSLGGCNSLKNADVLKELKALTKLILSGCDSLKNVDGLKGLTELTDLDLSTCGSLQNTDGLNGLKKLKVLHLKYCDSLKNVDGLKGLIELTELDVSSCGSLQNVNGLYGMRKLTTLNLAYCDSLKNVDGLQGLIELTDLDLSECGSLQNIDGLDGLKKLTTLNLSACHSLQNADAIKNLSGLKEIDLTECTKIQKSQIEELRLTLPTAKILF